MNKRKEEKTMKTTTQKERFVTRTIKSALVTVSCYDIKKQEFIKKQEVFTGKFDASNIDFLRTHFSGIDTPFIQLLSVDINEEKWALPERLFLEYGKRITKAEAEAIESED